jgi:hypothetical protein
MLLNLQVQIPYIHSLIDVFRLKDVWKLEGADKSMFSHPYLLIFVKIYWSYMSPPGRSVKDRSLLHLIGEFPKITPQEAHFVGRILTSPPHILKEMSELSPTLIASDPISDQVNAHFLAFKFAASRP